MGVSRSASCRNHDHEHCGGYTMNQRRQRLTCTCHCHDGDAVHVVVRYSTTGHDVPFTVYDVVAQIDDQHGSHEVHIARSESLGRAVDHAVNWARSRGFQVTARGVTMKVLDIDFVQMK